MWRRSYDVPPDPLPIDDELSGIDERYADVPRELLPRAECLKDVFERMLPWWDDAIVPDLRTGQDRARRRARQLAARAREAPRRHDAEEQVIELNLPTGEPLVYELDDELQPPASIGPGGVRGRYLDPERAVAAADAVARQAG